MSKTMADHARSYRQRRAEKMARMEAALREIVAINPADLNKNDVLALTHSFLLARNAALLALNPGKEMQG